MSCSCHKHDHGHDRCLHLDLAWCKQCNVVYCGACGMEWGQKVYVPYPYPVQPYWTEPVNPNPWRYPVVTWTDANSATSSITTDASGITTTTLNAHSTPTVHVRYMRGGLEV